MLSTDFLTFHNTILYFEIKIHFTVEFFYSLHYLKFLFPCYSTLLFNCNTNIVFEVI